MTSHKFIENACEQIDAGIFSGDLLFNDESVAMLQNYIGRWQRAIAEYDAQKFEESDNPDDDSNDEQNG